jgi:hypothetical protein
VVVAILVGMGRGDSRIDTAAVEGMLGEAEDEPRTITWRFVDLSAERRLEGGAEWSARVHHDLDGPAYSCPL